MLDGKPVITWTPYGRQDTVSVLAKYMARDHAAGVVDEWWLCLNTDLQGQEADLRYAYQLARQHSWIKIQDRPAGMPRRHPKQRNTGYFYQYMTDPDTTFVRFDDDIVYVHPAAVERLVRSARQRGAGGGVASFPVMWNNSIISWFAQQSGIIPEAGTETAGYVWPKVGGPYCMDGIGWADGRFAIEIHRLLLDTLEDTSDSGRWIGVTPEAPDPMERFFFYQDFPVQLGTQFSVSVFASLGEMYAALPRPGVLVPDEEEHWHTVHQPRVLGQPNIIVGDALVSHFTFNPQRRIVLASNTLDRYRAIADKL